MIAESKQGNEEAVVDYRDCEPSSGGRARAQQLAHVQGLVQALASALTSPGAATTIVEHALTAFGAEWAGIWLLGPDGEHADLVHAAGILAQSEHLPRRVALQSKLPLALSMQRCEPVYGNHPEASQEAAANDGAGRATAVVYLPLVVTGRALGALTLTFSSSRAFDAHEHCLFSVFASHGAQALERVLLYEAERRARHEMTLLYRLLDSVSRATALEDLYEPALDAVQQALQVERSAILLYDDAGVMRFRCFRGLSAEYRAAVEGHSPWPRDAVAPSPVLVNDVLLDPELRAYEPVFASEGIRALAFIPLVHGGELLGKFMVYSAVPRVFTAHEISLARSIASQVAQAVVRKRAEAEVRAARAAAEEASRTKDEFLAVVSHELRTPLASISGWAALLQQQVDDPALVRRAVDVIARNARAQTRIVEDILDVSRIVAGKLVLEPRPVNLANVVWEALEALRITVASKGIEVEFEPPTSDVPPVLGDSERLRQVIWNLLSNAAKFTPPGGRITVRMSLERGTIAVRVEDTGRGIDPAFLPHVFERFRQGDSTTTRRHGGLGLGLAIVRHLVELHGGTVRAESDGPGRGAAFTVVLPVSKRELPSAVDVVDPLDVATACAPPHAVSLAGTRILVVDDEPDARDLYEHCLASLGALVETAPSARGALGRIAESVPDLLISDIGMPGEDGLWLVRTLRALPEPLSRLPAVALTAYATPEDQRRILEAGFQGYLAKPCEPRHLAEVVQRTLRHGSNPAFAAHSAA
ncbi:MAG: ATP-binding protein [Pseudomonadota bacterium]